MKLVKLLQPVVLTEDGEPMVEMPMGTVCKVLHEYYNPTYVDGRAIVIFDGKEACSVSPTIVEVVE